jgi:hypothetical protein
MPIVTADIKIRLSIKTGSAGNTAAQPDPNASLGKYISTTDLVDNSANNLFDNISGDENALGIADYRAVFIYNSHGTLTLIGPKVWFSADVAGGAVLDMGLDTTAASAVGASAAQALQVATETDAPVGVTFSRPTTKSAGLSLGDIPPGQCRAIWIKRTAQNTAALNNDGGTISVEGDTAA